MANEPEVIRSEMQETRTSLSEKIEALSQQLVGTVQDAREVMKETVGTVKEAVTDTVSTVKDQVTGTISDVKQSVTGTVTDVRESVTGTVTDVKQSFGSIGDSVRDTFDLERQVVNHPWLMVGGAVAAGYLGGVVLHKMNAAPRSAYPDFPPPRPSAPVRQDAEWASTRNAGQTAAAHFAGTGSAPAPVAPQVPGAVAQMMKQFEPEIQQLKGVAIGALFGVIRDIVQKNLPPTLTQPVTEVVDNLTTKMGGQPVRGHLLDTGNSGR